MIRIYAAIFMAFVLTSCNSSKTKRQSDDKGMIIPKKKSAKFSPKRPIGMVPIPSGSFVMGQTDYDFTNQNNATPKTVSVSGFFMDDTEIRNSEYQDFVSYVRDSIIRQRLAERAYEMGYDGGEDETAEGGIADYAFKVRTDENGEPTAYEQYINEMADGRSGYESERQLNWDIPIIWDKYQYPDADYVEVMEEMYYPPEDRFNGERLIDVRKLNYVFTEIDKNKAAQASKDKVQRHKFVVTDTVNVYPDTTVWVRDFAYAYNDPLHQDYFWNEAYSDYPVVGVTWDQARAFCAYRTAKHQNYSQSKKKGKENVIVYRLPTEVEWEYAARGGLEDAPYPWGGPYLTDSRGCYLANFKPKRGDYLEDCCAKSKKEGFIYTAPVKSFYPNDYGLYDMSGNVSEWTQSPYSSAAYEYTATLNPYLGTGKEVVNKTIKGGSWKDVGFLLMVGSRDYENKDSARSFIGFRTVQTIPEGADVNYKRIRQ